jgi:hypothetical protein
VGREHASSPPITSAGASAIRSAEYIIPDLIASSMPRRCEVLACAAASLRTSQIGEAVAASDLMGRSIDTATLAFGLVSIPVKIYSTSEPSHELHFHLVHEGCGERLHQHYVCPTHGAVERADIIKGYELTKGSFIELSKAELGALEAVA